MSAPPARPRHRAGAEVKLRNRRRDLRRALARIDRALERNAVEARTLRRRRADRLDELNQIEEARRER